MGKEATGSEKEERGKWMREKLRGGGEEGECDKEPTIVRDCWLGARGSCSCPLCDDLSDFQVRVIFTYSLIFQFTDGPFASTRASSGVHSLKSVSH